MNQFETLKNKPCKYRREGIFGIFCELARLKDQECSVSVNCDCKERKE